MKRKLWNLSNLTIEQLDELIDMQKVSGLPDDVLLEEFSRKHPGVIDGLGELNLETNEYKREVISENGVKTENDLGKMIHDILKDKDEENPTKE